MKKIVFLIALFVLITMIGFAQSDNKKSAGVGLNFSNDFGGGVEAFVFGAKAGHYYTPYNSIGLSFYFDVIYAEIGCTFFGMFAEWEDYGVGVGTNTSSVDAGGMDLSLYGKYPFQISNNLYIFPLAGINYRLYTRLAIDNVNYSDGNLLNALWLKFGGGTDFYITNNMYLRLNVLYGFRLKNDFEDQLRDALFLISQGMAKIDYIQGHGLEIKLAIGFTIN